MAEVGGLSNCSLIKVEKKLGHHEGDIFKMLSKTEEADLSSVLLKLYLNGLKCNLAF